MGRMHAPGKGLSQSALPYRRSVPTWLKLTSDDVKEQIFKLAKKGLTPSQIGVILRDSHGVAQVRFVTGNKILRILKSKGLAPDLPEDLYHLIKKAVAVRKHLERNRKDKDAKFRLILIESRIHRLARYYKTKRVLAPNWKYESLCQLKACFRVSLLQLWINLLFNQLMTINNCLIIQSYSLLKEPT
ncbi:40S ribosomal protein S13 isoform X1 [Cyprinodon tularosa]|uniref:40S ribosomal protein S13 isoform X1 n=1 Tax=Cyprinodon tularosa TaxID=77115 RepID=UPI0018E21B1F|nr:40S ribosomal protein S13 isoform X1 [Cyprinodon tularosa]